MAKQSRWISASRLASTRAWITLTRMKTFEAIAEELLKISAADIKDSLTPKDVPHWDSMNYLLFIAELEKEYNISFTMDEVLNAGTLGAVRSLARAKGATV